MTLHFSNRVVISYAGYNIGIFIKNIFLCKLNSSVSKIV